MNRGFVLPGGVVSASWDYVNEDNCPQDSAQVCLANVDGESIEYGDIVAHAGAEQNVKVDFTGYTPGQYYLAVRVRAASGRQSEWSVPVAVYVPAEPTISFSTDLINQENIMTTLDGSIVLTMSTDNIPAQYTVSIVRRFDYHIDRPDDSVFDGFEGESIWMQSGTHSGTSETITYAIVQDELIGALDDNAGYTLSATITDDMGQTVTVSRDFDISWDEQPTMPQGQISVDKDNGIALITVDAPAVETTETFDVYRLTADKPEKILEDCSFGVTYVDPYPAIGEAGGHRIVQMSKYKDYITEDRQLAWLDLGPDDGDLLDEECMIIDADGMQIRLPYNIELSNRWQKDFQRTAYLGGSVQGDWNPSVLKDLTAKTVIVRGDDEFTDMRDLAEYAGPAHIRTPDGSSFACDIQVAEDTKYNDGKVTYNLTIRAIDPQELEGMTLAEWNEQNAEE